MTTTAQALESVNGASHLDDRLKLEGTPYPFKSYESLFEFVTKVYTELGHDIYHTRDQIAAANNLASNTIKQHLSSAQLFKLLEIKHGTGYKTTDLFAKIYLPDNQEEQRENILESLRSFPLYNELLSNYEKSGILPNSNGVTNVLIRQYKFSESLATKVTKDFISTLRNYGFLDDKNILRLATARVVSSSSNLPQVIEYAQIQPKQEEPKELDDTATHSIVIPLYGEEREARVTLPKKYTSRDLKKIARIVHALSDDEDEE